MGLLNEDTAVALGLLGGQMARGDFGGGLLSANQYMAGADDRRMKRMLTQAQISDMAQQAALRQAQVQKMNEGFGLLGRVLGGQGTPSYQQGQLGSGTMGVIPNSAPLAPAPSGPGGLAGATPDQIAALKAYGFDLESPWKTAKEGFTVNPGTYTRDAYTGAMRFNADPNKPNIPDGNGGVMVQPGYNAALTGTTLAQEMPKAFAGQAFGGNLRQQPGPNGRQVFVPNMQENPFMQQYAQMIFGGQPQGMPQSAPPQAPSRAAPARAALPAPQSGVTGAYDLNDPALMAAINDIKDPQERSNALAALRQQAGPGYGMTPNEQIKAKANETYDTDVAKTLGEQRNAIMNAGYAAPQNIAKMQRLGQLLQDVDGGKLTPAGFEVASTLNSLGIKVSKNLGNVQAAQAGANEMALQLRSPQGGAGMPGALSDKDREFLQSMTPNVAQSADGRAKVVNAYVAMQQRNQQIATFARNYEKKYGRLDNGFFDQLQQWSNANPLFKGQ